MYSVVESITKAIWLNRYSKSNPVVFMATKMYTAHFDESGTHGKDARILTVSGFVSDVDKWKRFELLWPQILIDAGLPKGTLFHMRQFARGDGVFAIFKNQSSKRAALVSELIRCTRSNVNKAFSCSVVLRDWEKLNERYELKEHLGYPYPFCGLICISFVHRWTRKNKIKGPIEFFFEDGATYKGQLKTLAEAQCNVTPIFLPKTKMVQFQCCDLLAWKHRRAIGDALEYGPTEDPAILASILRSQEELERIPNKSGVHDYASLELLCSRAKLPKRVA